jgi:predicted amidophosphoribosyltransferase
MENINSDFRAQWMKPMVSLFDYLPTKYEASPREWAVRDLIWDFKEGKRSKEVALKVAEAIRNHFGSFADTLTLACIPAHDADANAERYEEFSKEVCRLTGMSNGYNHIHVEGERYAIHEDHDKNSEKGFNKVYVVNFDKEYFNGRRVLVFDDILTKGVSYARFACVIEDFGAEVVGGYFLGRTLMN